MPSVSRREFLKLTGAGVVSSIVSCGCASPHCANPNTRTHSFPHG